MKCLLKPINRKYHDIVLQNGVLKIIGRGPETNILNSRCSKKQVELTANYKLKTVKVKQIGPNHSGRNGSLIGMGLEETLKDGDVLDLLLGELQYKIHFENDSIEESPPVKIPKMFQPKQTANDFKKDNLLSKGIWETKDDHKFVIYILGGESALSPKPNVASFDMDGTIITTKSGKVFPKDQNDWKFLYPQTVTTLQKFFESREDFKFVIFTNQGGCKTSSQLDIMKRKIEVITRQLGIPVLIFIAPYKNQYRKPLTGGWETFVKEYNGGIQPDLKTSFYCGDAAGRKKDHALSDRLFALNIGITFKLPEEFFLNGARVQEFAMPIFDPKQFMKTVPNNNHVQLRQSQEMIIMIGYPGSGKSSFVKSVILPNSYMHVNRDTLKTQAKCLSVAENALKNGQSVVVDNTNPEKKDRAEYIKLAKRQNVPVRCFKMNVDHAHALHNNKFRELTNASHSSVPAVAFNTFKSRFQEPGMDEGFTEIVPIHFVPNFENCPEPERTLKLNLYSSYLLEK